VITSMVNQLDPQTVVLHFSDIAKATKGVFRTDIPQEALASLATLAVKTKQTKITSVNFVPPLIQPYKYDPQVVRDIVASTIDKAETADEQAAARADGSDQAAPAASAGTGKPSKPKKQAVMDRPGADPDANTSDLASVCSVS
jgi:polyisoprenyl-teichoic acid--peptidoglycan teichoic acid transferase